MIALRRSQFGSTNNRFKLAFSSSKARRRRTSDTSNSPYSVFQFAEGRLGDAMLAGKLRRFRPSFMFPQHADHLLFPKPMRLHRLSPLLDLRP